MQEAVQCVEELEQPAMLYVFVGVGVTSTLERSQITRDHMGQLLYQLLQAGILHKLQFFKGWDCRNAEENWFLLSLLVMLFVLGLYN